MKKTLTTLLFLLPLFVVSQSKVNFGIQTGLGISSLSGSVDELAFSYQFGGFANYTLGQKTYLKIKLLYSRMGNQGQYSSMMLGGPSELGDFKRALNYIQIPINYNLKSKNEVFDAGFGPSLDYLIQSKTTYFPEGENEYKQDMEYDPFQIGIVVELNFHVNKSIDIYTNYYQGITEISNNSYSDGKSFGVFAGLNYKLN